MILRAHGLSVVVPRGWDGRIFRRDESAVTSPAGLGSGSESGVASVGVPQSGRTMPVMHLANFALPENRGDYGSGAVNLMRPRDVFVAMLEFGPESVGTPLFAPAGLPALRADDLTSETMQHPVATMGGAQRFFTVSGRAFCTYAVVGSLARRSSLVAMLNDALSGVTVGPDS